MSRIVLLIVAGLAVLGDGYLCGRASGRWKVSKELEIAASKLEELPRQFGDWVAVGEPVSLPAKEVAMAGFAGYAVRNFEHKRSGARVTVLIACGRPGPLAVHTPQVCYGGAGYQLTEEPKRWPSDNSLQPSIIPLQGFWKATFSKPDLSNLEKLRVLWSWYGKDGWTAAESPRWEFAGRSVLYKMYVSHVFIPRESKVEEDVSLQFVREFLPVVNKYLTVNP